MPFCINLVCSTCTLVPLRHIFCLLPYVQVRHVTAALLKVQTHVVHTGEVFGLLNLHLKDITFNYHFPETSVAVTVRLFYQFFLPVYRVVDFL